MIGGSITNSKLEEHDLCLGLSQSGLLKFGSSIERGISTNQPQGHFQLKLVRVSGPLARTQTDSVQFCLFKLNYCAI